MLSGFSSVGRASRRSDNAFKPNRLRGLAQFRHQSSHEAAGSFDKSVAVGGLRPSGSRPVWDNGIDVAGTRCRRHRGLPPLLGNASTRTVRAREMRSGGLSLALHRPR